MGPAALKCVPCDLISPSTWFHSSYTPWHLRTCFHFSRRTHPLQWYSPTWVNYYLRKSLYRQEVPLGEQISHLLQPALQVTVMLKPRRPHPHTVTLWAYLQCLKPYPEMPRRVCTSPVVAMTYFQLLNSEQSELSSTTKRNKICSIFAKFIGYLLCPTAWQQWLPGGLSASPFVFYDLFSTRSQSDFLKICHMLQPCFKMLQIFNVLR